MGIMVNQSGYKGKVTLVLVALPAILLIHLLSQSPLAETPHHERVTRPLGFPQALPIIVIPTAVNTPGRFGAYYKTRVTLGNMAGTDLVLQAIVSGPRGIVRDKFIELKANQYRVWDNFLAEEFDYRGAGGIAFISDQDLGLNIQTGTLDFEKILASQLKFVVTAEVYTDSPQGRYSTTVVNGIAPFIYFHLGPSLTAPRQAYNFGIDSNENQRVNIGCLNPTLTSRSLRAVATDPSTGRTQTFRFEMLPFSWQQKSVSIPMDNGYVQWEWDQADAFLYLWAVTVNNQSNDGTLTWATRP